MTENEFLRLEKGYFKSCIADNIYKDDMDKNIEVNVYGKISVF